MQLRATMLLCAIGLAVIPGLDLIVAESGVAKVIAECIHGHDVDHDHESTDDFCGDSCSICSVHAQAVAPVDHTIADLSLAHETRATTLQTVALADGFSLRLDRPPAA